MAFQDFFYFSKGERRALILLLCVISVIFALLITTDSYKDTHGDLIPELVQTIIPDTTRQIEPSRKLSQTQKPTVSPRRKEALKSSSYRNKGHSTKYPKGTIVELNTADTTILKKVPGIGTVYANRIVKFRESLGGFYSVSQLKEVYGMDEEKYNELRAWFKADTSTLRKVRINEASFDSLLYHPYIDYSQARIILKLRRQKGKLSDWESLHLLEEFAKEDKMRLTPYLSFE